MSKTALKRQNYQHDPFIDDMIDINSVQNDTILLSNLVPTPGQNGVGVGASKPNDDLAFLVTDSDDDSSSDNSMHSPSGDASPIQFSPSFQLVNVLDASPTPQQSWLTEQLQYIQEAPPPGLGGVQVIKKVPVTTPTGGGQSSLKSVDDGSTYPAYDPFLIPGVGVVETPEIDQTQSKRDYTVYFPFLPRCDGKRSFFTQISIPANSTFRYLQLIAKDQFFHDLQRLFRKSPILVDPVLAAYVQHNMYKRVIQQQHEQQQRQQRLQQHHHHHHHHPHHQYMQALHHQQLIKSVRPVNWIQVASLRTSSSVSSQPEASQKIHDTASSPSPQSPQHATLASSPGARPISRSVSRNAFSRPKSPTFDMGGDGDSARLVHSSSTSVLSPTAALSIQSTTGDGPVFPDANVHAVNGHYTSPQQDELSSPVQIGSKDQLGADARTIPLTSSSTASLHSVQTSQRPFGNVSLAPTTVADGTDRFSDNTLELTKPNSVSSHQQQSHAQTQHGGHFSYNLPTSNSSSRIDPTSGIKTRPHAASAPGTILEFGFVLEDIFLPDMHFDVVVFREVSQAIDTDIPPLLDYAKIFSAPSDTFALQLVVAEQQRTRQRSRFQPYQPTKAPGKKLDMFNVGDDTSSDDDDDSDAHHHPHYASHRGGVGGYPGGVENSDELYTRHYGNPQLMEFWQHILHPTKDYSQGSAGSSSSSRHAQSVGRGRPQRRGVTRDHTEAYSTTRYGGSTGTTGAEFELPEDSSRQSFGGDHALLPSLGQDSGTPYTEIEDTQAPPPSYRAGTRHRSSRDIPLPPSHLRHDYRRISSSQSDHGPDEDAHSASHGRQYRPSTSDAGDTSIELSQLDAPTTNASRKQSNGKQGAKPRRKTLFRRIFCCLTCTDDIRPADEQPSPMPKRLSSTGDASHESHGQQHHQHESFILPDTTPRQQHDQQRETRLHTSFDEHENGIGQDDGDNDDDNNDDNDGHDDDDDDDDDENNNNNDDDDDDDNDDDSDSDMAMGGRDFLDDGFDFDDDINSIPDRPMHAMGQADHENHENNHLDNTMIRVDSQPHMTHSHSRDYFNQPSASIGEYNGRMSMDDRRSQILDHSHQLTRSFSNEAVLSQPPSPSVGSVPDSYYHTNASDITLSDDVPPFDSTPHEYLDMTHGSQDFFQTGAPIHRQHRPHAATTAALGRERLKDVDDDGQLHPIQIDEGLSNHIVMEESDHDIPPQFSDIIDENDIEELAVDDEDDGGDDSSSSDVYMRSTNDGNHDDDDDDDLALPHIID